MAELAPSASYLGKVFPLGADGVDPELLAIQRTFRPRRRSAPVEVRFPMDWMQADNPDRNFRMQVQGWTMLHPIMDVFDELHDKTSAVEYFFDVLEDWWSTYEDSPEDVVTSRTPDDYTWYDMSTGFRALILAFFACRIEHFGIPVTSGREDTLRAAIDKHRRHLRQEQVIYPNNHGIFQVHGLRALTTVSRDQDSAADAARALEWMARLLRAQFDDNGVHLEHSPQYHKFVLDTFTAVHASGWYAESSDFTTRLERASAALPWLLDAQRRPAAVGDSLPAPLLDVELPDPQGAAEVIGSSIADSGYAIVRSNWGSGRNGGTFLFVTGGYHSKTHKHRDCLSFEWTEEGVKRVADSGKYGYWAGNIRRYMLSSRAHNSLEIEGFDILRMSPYGSALSDPVEDAAGIWHLGGELSFRSLRHRRRFFFAPGKWLIVQDQAVFARPKHATQWFHVGLGFERVSAQGQATMAFRSAAGDELLIRQLGDGLDERAVHGQDFDEPTMQGFVSEHDDDVQPGWAVGFSRPPGTSFRGLAALALSQEGLQDAENFARTLEFDPSLALAAFDGAPAESRDAEEPPSARRPGVGGWFDALRRR